MIIVRDTKVVSAPRCVLMAKRKMYTAENNCFLMIKMSYKHVWSQVSSLSSTEKKKAGLFADLQTRPKFVHIGWDVLLHSPLFIRS